MRTETTPVRHFKPLDWAPEFCDACRCARSVHGAAGECPTLPPPHDV